MMICVHFISYYCLVLMLSILKKALPFLALYIIFSRECFYFSQGQVQEHHLSHLQWITDIQRMFWTQFCVVWLSARMVKPLRFWRFSWSLHFPFLYFFTRKVETQKITLLCWVQFLNMFIVEPEFTMPCLVLAIKLIWNIHILNRSFF